MLFSSNLFLFVFLPAILAVYAAALAVRRSTANLVLLIASLCFYAWGSGWVVLVLVVSAVVNFMLGRQLAPADLPARRWILAAGVAVNMAVLFYFKYASFAYDNVYAALALFGRDIPHDIASVALPVGVSFYTFMSTAYLVDSYRGIAQARSLTDYALYLSLFPHLVAGPVVRFAEIKQDIESRSHSLDDFYEGMCRFCAGLAKKVLIANTLSVPADAIFALPADQRSFSIAWLGAICYSFQIFFDFSGYTDMAIGLARMLGFKFPENFAQPYRSGSVTEFWRKWHMTLTRWFRDYLYIPLGGNRRGNASTYLNLFTVFFLCGLWHGAAWTFVIWGIYHGVLLVFERLLGTDGKWRAGLPGIGLTFFLVTVGWVFFRATSIGGALDYLRAMGGVEPAGLAAAAGEITLRLYLTNSVAATLAVAMIVAFWRTPRSSTWPLLGGMPGRMQLSIASRGLASVGLLVLSLAYLSDATYNPFIYFRF